MGKESLRVGFEKHIYLLRIFALASLYNIIIQIATTLILSLNNRISSHQDQAVYVLYHIVVAVVIAISYRKNKLLPPWERARNALELPKLYYGSRAYIIIPLLYGIAFSLTFFEKLQIYISPLWSELSVLQIYFIISFPAIFGILTSLRKTEEERRQISKKAKYLISDIEIEKSEHDRLKMKDGAIEFANRVMGTADSKAVIYGVDAPWGTGKSSFINMCVERWESSHHEEVIVYRFNPLQFEASSSLMEKFSEGLANTILSRMYIPGLRSAVNEYTRIVSTTSSFSVAGFTLDFAKRPITVDEAYQELEAALRQISFKVFVIIDDLDRIGLSEIKNVLNLVKKSFSLSNVTYILCYDTENIAASGGASREYDEVAEFFEKYVTLRIGLYLKKDIVIDYIKDDLNRNLEEFFTVDRGFLEKILGKLISIINSNEYSNYTPLIGNIRKIKRFVNTIIYLDISRNNLTDVNIHYGDLIHLLLLYLYHPGVFRKVYDAETCGGFGYFSTTWNEYSSRDQDRRPDRTKFEKYMSEIGERSKNAAFLLEKVFGSSSQKSTFNDELDPDERYSLAIINEMYGERNLERYLNLIVDRAPPVIETQMQFYWNIIDEIKNGVKVSEILARASFEYSKGDETHKRLWDVISNKILEFDIEVSNSLIREMCGRIKEFSYIGVDGGITGPRARQILKVVSILDRAGWSDEKSLRYNNSSGNISEIVDWIFGLNRHKEHSVLDALIRSQHPLLSIYDLLQFRLFCCESRMGNFHNVYNALDNHGRRQEDKSLASANLVGIRALSRKIFSHFKTTYIVHGRSVFCDALELDLENITGSYSDYYRESFTSYSKTESEILSYFRMSLLVFVLYQLSNCRNESGGTGCGFYFESSDNVIETGVPLENKDSIRWQVSEYLLSCCFHPFFHELGYLHFVDFLIASSRRDLDGNELLPDIHSYLNFFDKDMLATYWRDHGEKVRNAVRVSSDVDIATPNFVVRRSSQAEGVFTVLDSLCCSGVDVR